MDRKVRPLSVDRWGRHIVRIEVFFFGEKISGYNVLRLALGVLLLTTAGLKAYQLATEPILGGGWMDSRWFLIFVVEFELLFGLWLLSGLSPKTTWTAAVACFSLFSCVSLDKALSGQATCGCFGKVEVNPWITAALDIAIVLSLLYWRPKGSKQFVYIDFEQLPLRAAGVLAIWLLLGVPAALAMGNPHDAALSDAGEMIGNGKAVVLKPETWIGNKFPLLNWIETDEALDRGQWTVIMHRSGCDKCERLIGDYENGVLKFDTEKAAFIDLESGEETPFRRVLRANVSGCMRGGYYWLGETPLVLRIDRGKVISVAHGPPSY